MKYYNKYKNEELIFNNEQEVFKAVKDQIVTSYNNKTYGKSEALLEICLQALVYYDRGVIGIREGIPKFENTKEFFDYWDNHYKINGKMRYIYYPLIREKFLNLLINRNFEELYKLVQDNAQIAQEIAPNYLKSDYLKEKSGYLIFVPDPFAFNGDNFYWAEVSTTFNNLEKCKWVPINQLRHILEVQIYIKE